MADLIIALAGNPNTGKSTIFNVLTGSKQHVGNWPGKTVEQKIGYFTVQGKEIELVDLPGTYSLSAFSAEEQITRDYIVKERPAVVINMVDANNLERNLYLTTQILETGVPVIIVLNMLDMARRHGIDIDTDKMSELLGVPVVPMVARQKKGVETLKTLIATYATDTSSPLKVAQ